MISEFRTCKWKKLIVGQIYPIYHSVHVAAQLCYIFGLLEK